MSRTGKTGRCFGCGVAVPRSIRRNGSLGRAPSYCSEACRPRCVREGCDRPQRKGDICGSHYATDFERARHERDPGYRRRQKLRLNFGITPEEYDQMVVAQAGGCAICGDPVSLGLDVLEVDHDHTTGRIRGLLCGRCNKGIGLFRDDPSLLRRAVAYLQN